MSRFTVGLVIAASLAGTALAETQAEIANRENEEGKTLMFSGKYSEATAKFRDAVARAPEAKYFFNLCTSLYQEGKFGEALTACNSADKINQDDKLKSKIAKLSQRVRDEAKAQGIDLQPVGGGGGETNVTDPNNPDPTGNPTDPNNPNPTGNPTDPNNPNPTGNPTGPQPTQPYAVGRPPTQGLFQAAPPDNKYTWTLGVDLYGGGGTIGQKDYFGTSAGGVRFKGDYLLNPAQRFGVQGYFQLTHFGQGKMDALGAQTLDIFDVGIAAYKHLCKPTQRLCFTPLAGAQIALMSPANQTDGTGSQVFNYAALGGRLEVAMQYAFGTRMEHVLGVMLGVNLYTKVFSEPMDGYTAAEWGLDKGGAAGYFGLGYTYRFNTPFGQAPFVTLE